MVLQLNRLFLDTNVYILGADNPESYEGKILYWLGWGQETPASVEVILSEAVLEQISRVAKRLRHKDWAGEIIRRIWQDLNSRYVVLEPQALGQLKALATIPREDIGVYLTAKMGKAQCFVSANHKLIRTLVEQTGEFECLTPEEFVNRYVAP